MIHIGHLLLVRTLSGIVSKLVARVAFDLAQIFLLLLALLTGLGLAMALFSLDLGPFAC